MAQVVIGVDPHKRSATIEVLDKSEKVLATGRFGTDRDGYKKLLAAGRGWPDRLWAVEGCEGVGRHIAQRLVADGEPVVDVPAKLSARVRVFSTGQGRKTDATEAHSVAVVALRTPGLRPVQVDGATVALRLLVDRRDELGAVRTLTVNRLLVELIPGGAKTFLSATQAKALLATVRPRDLVGKTRRKLAAELIAELDGSTSGSRSRLPSFASSSRPPAAPCSSCTASVPPARPACSMTSATCPGSRPEGTSRPGTAPPRSMPPQENRIATGSPEPATGGSTGRYTSWRSFSCATTPKAGTTTGASSPPARPRWKRSAPSNGGSPTSSTASSWPTRNANAAQQRGKAREDKWGRLLAPARPTPTPTSTLRRSHFPDPPDPKLRPPPRPAQTHPRPLPGAPFTGGSNQPVDTEGSHERVTELIYPSPGRRAKSPNQRARPATKDPRRHHTRTRDAALTIGPPKARRCDDRLNPPIPDRTGVRRRVIMSYVWLGMKSVRLSAASRPMPSVARFSAPP